MHDSRQNSRAGRTPGLERAYPVRLDGRTVGMVVADEYRRTLRPEHVLQRPVPAVAVSLAVLDEAARLGAVVGVWTLPDGSQAVMGLDAFRAVGRRIDRGHGAQLAVPLDAFPRRRPAGNEPWLVRQLALGV